MRSKLGSKRGARTTRRRPSLPRVKYAGQQAFKAAEAKVTSNIESTDDDRWLDRWIAAQQAVIDQFAREGVLFTGAELDEIFARDKRPPTEFPDFSGTEFDDPPSGH